MIYVRARDVVFISDKGLSKASEKISALQSTSNDFKMPYTFYAHYILTLPMYSQLLSIKPHYELHGPNLVQHRQFSTSGKESHPILSDDEEVNKENYFENYYKLVHGFALPHIGSPALEADNEKGEIFNPPQVTSLSEEQRDLVEKEINIDSHSTRRDRLPKTNASISKLSSSSGLSTTLTHTDADGKCNMVDVGAKDITLRTARARCRVILGPTAYALVRDNSISKGDVLSIAQIAGIMAAKRTSSLIPLCHDILLNKVDVRLTLSGEGAKSGSEDDYAVDIVCEVRTQGRTGAEMEALTGASIAALTVYDMCKAVTRDMVITELCLMEKTGGMRQDYHRREKD